MESKINKKNDCVFCKGTGIAEYFDFLKLDNFPDGLYELNNLINQYGKCPECCVKVEIKIVKNGKK